MSEPMKVRRTESQAGLPNSPILSEILTTRQVKLRSGETRPLSGNISRTDVAALHRTVLDLRPRVALEIGMGHGVSTLAILAALAEHGGRLISIDPYYAWSAGREAALFAVERAGFGSMHTYVDAPSYQGLPELLRDNVQMEFAYIDGAHDYPNVFVDAFYVDKLLRPGGVVGFNDVGWSGVRKAVQWMSARNDYAPLDVGLRRDYRGRNVLITAVRWALGWSREDRYFRKSLEAPNASS